MVLAAGYGTRLLPFTRFLPKPLFPIVGKRVVSFSLDMLKKAGVKNLIMNLHHLPDMVRGYLTNSHWGMKITYSFEPEILGTGGGVAKVRDLLGNSPFYLLNCDIVTDVDLKELAEFHSAMGGIATMVLVRFKEGEEKYAPVKVGSDGRVIDIADILGIKDDVKEIGVFTGIHIIEHRILDYLPEESPSCIVRDGYIPALKAGERIQAFFTTRYWREVSTCRGYFLTNMELLNHLYGGSRIKGITDSTPFISFTPRAEEFEQPIYIGKGVITGKGAVLGPNAIIGDGTVLGDGVRVENSIVLPYSIVPPHTDVFGEIFLSSDGSVLRERVISTV